MSVVTGEPTLKDTLKSKGNKLKSPSESDGSEGLSVVTAEPALKDLLNFDSHLKVVLQREGWSSSDGGRGGGGGGGGGII